MDPLQRKVDWDEYRQLPADQRWELIDGQLYAMTPAPLRIHQRLSMELSARLWLHFQDKSCAVYTAPLDVKLSANDTVQPDLMVVCDAAQLKDTHIDGPPALVIEILSPTSVRHDRIRKFRLYAQFGVKEYWLVHPTPAMVEVFLLDGPGYRAHGTYSDSETLESPSFPGLRLDLSTIFPYQEIDEVREGHPALAR